MVYVLTDSITKKVIAICDDLDNAKQWKENMVEVGEYRGVDIAEFEISTDKILPLSAVEISGKMSVAGFKLSVAAYNPSGTVTDEVSFTMGEKEITFTGHVNLTQSEQDLFNLLDVKERITEWVKQEFGTKVEA